MIVTVADHNRTAPFLYCEVLDGRNVHLRIPVRHHKTTVCFKVVQQDGYIGDPNDRKMCLTCLRRTGWGRKRYGVG